MNFPPFGLTMLTPREKTNKESRPPNKSPNTRHEKPSLELLVRAVQETPETFLLFPLLLPQSRKELKVLSSNMHFRTRV